MKRVSAGLVTYTCSSKMKIDNKLHSWFLGVVGVKSLPFFFGDLQEKSNQSILFNHCVAMFLLILILPVCWSTISPFYIP